MKAGDERMMAVIELPTSADAIRFMRASEEIELSLEGTSVRIVNTAEYVKGEPPPANESPEAGHWHMVGVISGPEASDVPNERRDAALANWREEILSILEGYGLKAGAEEIPS
jgi:hypothetical protein